MTFWFYDPETNSLRYVNVDGDTPLAIALRTTSRAVSPGLWFATILHTLKELGHGVPRLPRGYPAAALVFWNDEGEAGYFPLAFAGTDEEDTVHLGFILHQIAQLMIDAPELWQTVKVPEDEDDGEEEEGDFGYHF